MEPQTVEAPPPPLNTSTGIAEPDPSKRFPFGWVLLALVFGLLILVVTGAERPTNGVKSYRAEEVRLRSLYMVDSLTRLVETPMALEQADRQLELGLRTLLSELKRTPTESPDGATLKLVIQAELSEPLDEHALSVLEQSERPRDEKALSALMASTLTPEQAAEIEALPRERFSHTLLRIQALERAGDVEARERLLPRQQFLMSMLVLMGFMGFGMLGVVVLIAFGSLSLAGKAKPVGFPIRPMSNFLADWSAFRMACYLLSFLFLSGVIGVAGDRLGLPTMVIASASMVATFFAIVVVIQMRFAGMRFSIKEMMGDLRAWPKLVFAGVIGAAANLPVVLVLALGMVKLAPGMPEPTHPIQADILMAGNVVTILLLFFVAAVMAPLNEELTFRGLLFPALAKLLRGPVWGILASGFLFAAIHPQGVLAWPALMFVGCMAAFLSYQTGSLLPAIVMHAVHNGLLVGLSLAMR